MIATAYNMPEPKVTVTAEGYTYVHIPHKPDNDIPHDSDDEPMVSHTPRDYATGMC